jgi:hypothetical protein
MTNLPPADNGQNHPELPGILASVPAKLAATALTQTRSTAMPKRAVALSPTAAPNPLAWSARRPIWTGILTIVLLIAFFGGWGMMTTISGAGDVITSQALTWDIVNYRISLSTGANYWALPTTTKLISTNSGNSKIITYSASQASWTTGAAAIIQI